nr:hypothetical protein [Candidatus Gracilibacteria bacterium]
MILNKKGIILIYILILISIAMIMAMATLNNINLLSNNTSYQDLERELYGKIKNKGDIFIKYQQILNKDGTGFIDNISCPNNITMSGTTSMVTGITSILTYSGSSFFCHGVYNTKPFDIFLNSTYDSYIASSYEGSSVGLISYGAGLQGSSTFSDSDSTLISFDNSSYQLADSIDDNFNSDDYKDSSTGNISYPDGYSDNDDLGRKTVFGSISSTGVYENIFWSNFETNDYINNNSNNTGALNINIVNVVTGSLFLDVDKNFLIKMVKFDRFYYTKDTRELLAIGTYLSSGSILAGSGYIKNLGGVLSLTSSTGADTNFFNFRDNDYAIFLSNMSTGILSYKLTGLNIDNKKIYLNPINDSFPNQINYLGNYIIINPGNIYIGKQLEIFGIK